MAAEHLFYFTPKSLRRRMEQTPLEVVEFQTKGMDIPNVMSHFRDDKRLQPGRRFPCRAMQCATGGY
jgi:hypothetical protein